MDDCQCVCVVNTRGIAFVLYYVLCCVVLCMCLFIMEAHPFLVHFVVGCQPTHKDVGELFLSHIRYRNVGVFGITERIQICQAFQGTEHDNNRKKKL